MKRGFSAGLVASTLGLLAACSSTDQPMLSDGADAATTPQAADGGIDGDATTTTRPTQCSAPLVSPTCATTTPAKTADADVAKFVVDSAVPIRCGNEDNAVWDVRPLVELYGSNKMFMVGEVHGTNEIGIVSSVLLKELASMKLVTVLGFELPMDFEPVLQRYVDTGQGAGARFVSGMARNMFGALLTKTARHLAEKGVQLRVAAVDFPRLPDIAEAAIREVAAKLTTQKGTVLETLPHIVGQPTSADFPAANAYFDLVVGKKTEICAELSAPDCDRLVAMTHALWTTTLSFDDNVAQTPEWFARREEVIYYNMHVKMAAPTDRMFLHMGAAHTNKHSGSAGSRMAKEFEGTKGQVFSVAPAYGDGSVISYGGRRVDLTGEPQALVGPLTQAPSHPLFISTTRPSASCAKNPLADLDETSIRGGGTMGQLYDGYIHYGKVTSEREPSDTTLSPDDDVLGSALIAFRARIERRARAAAVRTTPGRLAPRIVPSSAPQH